MRDARAAGRPVAGCQPRADGQSGAATYAANDNIQYVGYYTAIGGTPFVLVTQAPLSVVFDNARNFFQVRVFIVGAGVFALLLLLALILNQLTAPPLNRLRRATQALSDGNFDMEVPDAKRGDEIGHAGGLVRQHARSGAHADR